MIKVNDFLLAPDHFPDNTLHLRLFPADVSGYIKIKWIYQNDAELFTIACIRKHFGNKPAMLIMDYIPHARMDRVEQNTDVFTLKYFCEIINSLNFSSVIVLDPHSNVSTALLDRVIVDDASDYILNAIEKCEIAHPDSEVALFYPDEGAMKRYSAMTLGHSFAFGLKKRDWATGKILSLDILQKENIVGKDVLIIDDICSKGGTFMHSAEALKEAGAKSVSLYVTHCEQTILRGDIFKTDLIETVYTTHSLIHGPELSYYVKYVDEEEDFGG